MHLSEELTANTSRSERILPFFAGTWQRWMPQRALYGLRPIQVKGFSAENAGTWPGQRRRGLCIGRSCGRENRLLIGHAGRQEGVTGVAQAGERIAMDAVTPCYRGGLAATAAGLGIVIHPVYPEPEELVRDGVFFHLYG